METTTIVAIAVAAVFSLILLVWFFSTWNRLINLDENAQNAWNNIDVLLNQRYDMIPNMVSIVKGYAEHEAGIFEQFAIARQTAAMKIAGRREGIPTLGHGDRWGGNARSLIAGRGSLYDPASWWADSEVDLAMTHLFGGFRQDFYCSYDDVLPPVLGAQERLEIYNLYHLLNHANLFGGGYVDQSRACLRRLARQMTS